MLLSDIDYNCFILQETYPPLQEFKSPLVLGHLQQLHGTLLISSMSSDFPNKLTAEFVVLGLTLKIK